MDLKILREYLDTLDAAIKYILVQRMSIIPLIAEYKIKNNLPFSQPQREEEMFERMRSSAEEMGLNPELIYNIYLLITSDSKKIQNEVNEKWKLPSVNDNILPNEGELMQQSLDRLKEFIELIDRIRSGGAKSGSKVIDEFSSFYRTKSK